MRELNQSLLDYQSAYQTAYQSIKKSIQSSLKDDSSRRSTYETKNLIIHYSKILTQLNKIYKKKNKFSDIDDNFFFKLIIYYENGS
jgi:hypothetical protein